MKRIEYIQSKKKNKSSKNTHIIYIEIVLYKHRIENTTRDTQQNHIHGRYDCDWRVKNHT